LNNPVQRANWKIDKSISEDGCFIVESLKHCSKGVVGYYKIEEFF